MFYNITILIQNLLIWITTLPFYSFDLLCFIISCLLDIFLNYLLTHDYAFILYEPDLVGHLVIVY